MLNNCATCHGEMYHGENGSGRWINHSQDCNSEHAAYERETGEDNYDLWLDRRAWHRAAVALLDNSQ